jgi:hypothetical protein
MKTPDDVMFVDGTWVPKSLKTMDKSIQKVLALDDFGSSNGNHAADDFHDEDTEGMFDDEKGQIPDHERKCSISAIRADDVVDFLEMDEMEEEKNAVYSKKALIQHNGGVQRLDSAIVSQTMKPTHIDDADIDLDRMDDDDMDFRSSSNIESLKKSKLNCNKQLSFSDLVKLNSNKPDSGLGQPESILPQDAAAPASQELHEFEITSEILQQFQCIEDAINILTPFHNMHGINPEIKDTCAMPAMHQFKSVHFVEPSIRFAWVVRQASLYDKSIFT